MKPKASKEPDTVIIEAVKGGKCGVKFDFLTVFDEDGNYTDRVKNYILRIDMAGTLYIVGTPIGNLKDITYRAVETLKSVDIIACEDTRHSRTLLDAYGISAPLVSYYKQKEREGSEQLVKNFWTAKTLRLSPMRACRPFPIPARYLCQKRETAALWSP